MRLRTSAALALVTALFASPLSMLACGSECGPASPVETKVEAVAPAQAEGSCHREVVEDTAARFTLTATPHDCSTHSPLIPRLINPNASTSLVKAVSVTVLLPHSRSVMTAMVVGAITSTAHDLAPPGRTPGLIAPLRI